MSCGVRLCSSECTSVSVSAVIRDVVKGVGHDLLCLVEGVSLCLGAFLNLYMMSSGMLSKVLGMTYYVLWSASVIACMHFCISI